jgi:hypothetical protein
MSHAMLQKYNVVAKIKDVVFNLAPTSKDNEKYTRHAPKKPCPN